VQLGAIRWTSYSPTSLAPSPAIPPLRLGPRFDRVSFPVPGSPRTAGRRRQASLCMELIDALVTEAEELRHVGHLPERH
jgi:hypothetical protein